jgi:hypothetical protein
MKMRTKQLPRSAGAQQRLELYRMAHPRSPSAVREPQLLFRSGTWIALLGQDVQTGIAGFGLTIEAALRAFDAQYLSRLRPPEEASIQKDAA